jgi:RND superfamily putative drug exporter
MLARLAATVIRRRRFVLVAALLVLLLAGVYGGGVASNLTGGGFDSTSSESAKAKALIEDQFGQSDPNLLLVVTAADGDIDSPASAAAGAALVTALSEEADVQQVTSYWSLGNAPPLRSTGGDKALVLAHIGGDQDAATERAAEVVDALRGEQAGGAAVTFEPGGLTIINDRVGSTIEEDLRTAEMIALPITLLLLIFVFGSLVAAALPLVVGIFAIISTFAVLQVMTVFTDVSIFSLNLTTALGLGLAIDYSLFVVSRFREELAAGHDTNAAVSRTVRTAGRTVMFSAATVAIALAAMLVFPMVFFRSFAYAGIAVALLAAFGAVVILPAMLAALGPKVNAGRVIRRREPVAGEGVWHRIAMFVMRRPVGIATAVIALLLVLGAPFLGIKLGTPDDRVLPPGDSVRATQQVLREEFTAGEASALQVVATGDATSDDADVSSYAASLSALPGVARVDARTGSFVGGQSVAPPGELAGRFVADDATWFSVVPSIEPLSAEGETLTKAVRDTASPFADVKVGGPSAELVDSKSLIFSRLPWALGIIAVTTFVVLFLLFGSLLVPLKAVLLNLLSLTATFGSMVWIFQEGHGAGLLNFTPTDTIVVAMPILMFCIAFGLSMDYEVFLLSRIKEEHDRGSDTTTSVAMGLERTGRIVTAAAVLIAVVFLAFATSRVSFIKMFGIGLTLAVLVDAFLIRSTLVPAFMRLAGGANWWAPAPLRRLYERVGLSEHVDLDDEASSDDDGAASEPVLVGQP